MSLQKRGEGKRTVLDIFLIIFGAFFLCFMLSYFSKAYAGPVVLFIGLFVSCLLILLSFVHLVKAGHPIVHGHRRESLVEDVRHHVHLPHTKTLAIVLLVISFMLLVGLNHVDILTGLATVEQTSLGNNGMYWTGRNVFVSEGAAQIDLSNHVFHHHGFNMTFALQDAGSLQAALEGSLLTAEFTSGSGRENRLLVDATDTLGNRQTFEMTLVNLLVRDVEKENLVAKARAENPIIGGPYEYVPEPQAELADIGKPPEPAPGPAPVTGPEYFDGKYVKDRYSRRVGEVLEDDPAYDTAFHSISKDADSLTIVFSHNADTALPIWIVDADDDNEIEYTLSTDTADPEENVTLIVQLVDHKVPKFNLHVGEESDVFGFGDGGGFQAQAVDPPCGYNPSPGETVEYTADPNCAGVNILSSAESGVIVIVNDGVTVTGTVDQTAGDITVNLGTGSIIDGAGATAVTSSGGTLTITGTGSSDSFVAGGIDASPDGGTDIREITAEGGTVALHGNTNTIGPDVTITELNGNDILTFDPGSSNQDATAALVGAADSGLQTPQAEWDLVDSTLDIDASKWPPQPPNVPPLKLSGLRNTLTYTYTTNNPMPYTAELEGCDGCTFEGSAAGGSNIGGGLKIDGCQDLVVRNYDLFTSGTAAPGAIAINVDPSFNITIANTTLANAADCLVIDDSNTTLVYNVTFANCSSNAVNITNASKDNVIRNSTFINNTIGVGIYNGSYNNTVYWNNFTNLSTPWSYFAFDGNPAAFNNSFNTSVGGTPQGNRWEDVFFNNLQIYDSDGDGYGDVGADYPYEGANSGNVSGLRDFGPAAPPLGCGVNLSQNVTLTQDYTSNGTCFTVTASNVVLDCAGHKITGNGSGRGVSASGSRTGIVVKNCEILNFSRGVYLSNGYLNASLLNNTIRNNTQGIRELDNVFNLTLDNNTLYNNSIDLVSLTSLALSIPYNNRIYFINQSVDTYNFSGAGLSLNSGSAFFIIISRFGILEYTSMVGGSGGNLTNHMVVGNNKILVNSTANNNLNKSANLTLYGISFADPEPYYDPEDDGSFTLCPANICTEQSYVGTTYKYNVSHFTTYKASVVQCGQTLTGDTNLTGDLSSNGTCFTIVNDSVTLDCAGHTITGNASGIGVFVQNVNNTLIENCTLRNFTDGVKIQGNAYDNTVRNNTVDNCTLGTRLVDTVRNTTYINNTFVNCTDDIVAQKNQPVAGAVYETVNLVDQPIAGYRLGVSGPIAAGASSVNLSVENSSAGVLRFLASFTGATGSNLYGNATSAIQIDNNRIFVNQTAQSGFNITANLTFYNISQTDPEPFYDPEDDGTFAQCPSNICTEQSYVGTTYKYNVSHFTAYKSQDIVLPCNTTISSNTTMLANMTCNGTALVINTSGISFDCAGNSISGNGTGVGIKIQNASNVTINNCTISNFVKDIDSDPATGTVIENSTIENATTCILFNETNQSVIRNNSLRNCTTYGIRLIDSYWNNITDNHLEYFLRGILLEETAANNLIDQNTLNNYSSSGFSIAYGISVDGDNNTVSDNRINNGTSTTFQRAVGVYLGYGEGSSSKDADYNAITGNNITNISGSSGSSAGVYVRRGIKTNISFNRISEIRGRGVTAEWNLTSIRNNTIFGSDGNGILLAQPGRGHIDVFGNKIYNIAGTSTPYGAGIKITDNCKHHNISYNEIYGCPDGMLLEDENANEDDLQFARVWANEVYNNSKNGIHLFVGQDVIVENNSAYLNGASGIVFNTTDYSNATNNTVHNNTAHGMVIFEVAGGGGGGPTTGNRFENNRVLDNTLDGIHVENSAQETVRNNTALRNNNGVALLSSDNCDVINNTASQNNVDGILINQSDNVWAVNNTAVGNTLDGIGLDAVINNTVEYNFVQGNSRGGVIVEHSNYSFIQNNTADSNMNNGFELFTSFFNNLRNNTATNNGKDGIQLDDATDNNVTDNIANSNTGLSWALPTPAGNGILLDANAHRNLIHNNVMFANFVGGVFLVNSDNNTVTNNTMNANNIGANVTGTSFNNTFYFNNFTSSKLAHAHADQPGNSFNRTNNAKAPGFKAEGNAWDDIASWQNYDSNADGFGDSGAQYPYGLQTDGTTIYGNVTGNVTDWGPMNANATPNTPPNTTRVILNSSFPTNFTEENITCYANITDPEQNSTLIAYFDWYTNGALDPSLSGSANISEGVLTNVSAINAASTAIGQNWTCSVKGYDGIANESAWTNSSNLTVLGCGNLGRSLSLIEDRTLGGSCFNLTADNVALDCNAKKIDGQNVTGSYGVLADSRLNITVEKCDLTNLSYGIILNRTNLSVIQGNRAYNNSNESFYLEYAEQNNLSDNFGVGKYIFIGFGSSQGRAAFFLDNSPNNRLVNNTHHMPAFTSGSADYAFYIRDSPGNTLINCTANQTNLEGYLILNSNGITVDNGFADNTGLSGYNLSNCSNSVIENSTVDNPGQEGFEIWDSPNIVLRNNIGNNTGVSCFHLTNSNSGTLQDNVAQRAGLDGIELTGSNSTVLSGNRIGALGFANIMGQYGISLTNSFYNNATNNTVLNSIGFYLSGSADNNITGNNVSFGSDGFEIYSGSDNNRIEDNDVNNNNNAGFDISGSNNNYLRNNSLSSNTWYGFWLNPANHTDLVGNTVTGTSAGEAFLLDRSYYNLLANNTANSNSDGIHLDKSNNNNITNCTANSNSNNGLYILDSNYTLVRDSRGSGNTANDLNVTDSIEASFIDYSFSSYAFLRAGVIFEDTANGILRFLNTSVTQSNPNLMHDIQFDSNSIFVNSTNAAGLNTTANLTFYNINATDPQPIVDYEDDGSFIICPASICTELSYTGATFVYNVTHFTNYSSNESNVTAPGPSVTAAPAGRRSPGGGGEGWDPRYASAETVHGIPEEAEEPEVVPAEPEVEVPKAVENITPEEAPEEEEIVPTAPYRLKALPKAKVTYKYWWFWVIILLLLAYIIYKVKSYAEKRAKGKGKGRSKAKGRRKRRFSLRDLVPKLYVARTQSARLAGEKGKRSRTREKAKAKAKTKRPKPEKKPGPAMGHAAPGPKRARKAKGRRTKAPSRMTSSKRRDVDKVLKEIDELLKDVKE